MFLLNLGSGQRPFKAPWTNVDCQKKWNPDIDLDITHLPTDWAMRVDMIVLHHVLEHFDCTTGPELLRECYRVLKPGGRLLVFVPDQRALAEAWLTSKIDDYLYTVNLMGAYMGDEADRHKWGYCFRSLHLAMRKAGSWQSICEFDWRPIEGADIARDWWILGVEGVKNEDCGRSPGPH